MDAAKICCRNSLDVVKIVIRGSKARNVCVRITAGERWARRQEQLVPGLTSFSRVQSPHMQELLHHQFELPTTYRSITVFIAGRTDAKFV